MLLKLTEFKRKLMNFLPKLTHVSTFPFPVKALPPHPAIKEN